MSIKTKRFIQASFLIGAIGLLIIGWGQRWNIYDSWRLRGYQPSADVAQLATQTTMNHKTRRLFYVYHPEIDDKEKFNNRCSFAELTIVLGCYVPSNGIYLYNVTDPRLDGVQQVTAAHETLHAAFDRLSGNDRKRILKLLEETYAKLDDKRIKDTIEEYRKKGADTTNELHSILGTEVRNLPPELEAYYGKYFENRLAIVEFSEKYEQAFTERKTKIAEADKQLAVLKLQIESGEADLNARQQTLRNDRERLDSLLEAKNYEAYNGGVGGFNAQVNAYNASVNRIRGLIEQYNRLVGERNALAEEQGELIKAIDS